MSPQIMGILNVTPDSFSDGGLYLDTASAIRRGETLVAEGADWIDVGGESTRPGAQPVSVTDELDRVIPVVEALADRGYRVSIDTMKAAVAEQAIAAGATLVNDVSGWSDPEMPQVCARHGVAVCIMHMQGEPRTMQTNPTYGDVVAEVRDFLLERANFAASLGLTQDQIYIDPGIGFGKSLSHNLALLRELPALVSTGFPVLLGTSRKSFIGRLLAADGEVAPLSDRLEGTLATQAFAERAGVAMLRVHDVASARRFATVYRAIEG